MSNEPSFWRRFTRCSCSSSVSSAMHHHWAIRYKQRSGNSVYVCLQARLRCIQLENISHRTNQALDASLAWSNHGRVPLHAILHTEQLACHQRARFGEPCPCLARRRCGALIGVSPAALPLLTDVFCIFNSVSIEGSAWKDQMARLTSTSCWRWLFTQGTWSFLLFYERN